MSDKHRAHLTLNNFPVPGASITITTRPVDENTAEAVAAEARSLGGQATVTKA